jgi:hypothetical protein
VVGISFNGAVEALQVHKSQTADRLRIIQDAKRRGVEPDLVSNYIEQGAMLLDMIARRSAQSAVPPDRDGHRALQVFAENFKTKEKYVIDSFLVGPDVVWVVDDYLSIVRPASIEHLRCTRSKKGVELLTKVDTRLLIVKPTGGSSANFSVTVSKFSKELTGRGFNATVMRKVGVSESSIDIARRVMRGELDLAGAEAEKDHLARSNAHSKMTACRFYDVVASLSHELLATKQRSRLHAAEELANAVPIDAARARSVQRAVNRADAAQRAQLEADEAAGGDRASAWCHRRATQGTWRDDSQCASQAEPLPCDPHVRHVRVRAVCGDTRTRAWCGDERPAARR